MDRRKTQQNREEKIRFSRRTDWELSANRLTSLWEDLRRGGQVYDLTESNPTRCGFAYPSDRILPALSSPDNLSYLPHPQGLAAAREEVCRYYRRFRLPVDPSQVFLTSSTSEAYSFLFRLLADPDDRVLFPRPSYPLFQFLVDLSDIVMDFYSLAYAGGWTVDFESLASEIRDRTRAIALVNPNNPTGSYVSPDERGRLNRICREKGLALISDEVFLDYSWKDPNPGRFSLAGQQEALTFVLGGVSKALALPQMKLSWIVVSGPAEETREAARRLEVIADTYLSVNTPVQNALPAWSACQEEIQTQARARVRQNREFVEQHLPPGTECLSAQAGWYAVLRLSPDISEEELALNLLEKHRVYVHPGYFFDFEDGAHLVISLLPEPQIFQEGFRRLGLQLAA
ncbi:MAG: pyridoxal phosphate-dependent aminotransferase [Candidatus Omnitrophota bacterium]|nr:pyridoxal phosphate-dependent aminotransferase [Candidatus Omnitrophota bacterium]MDZ4243066.1 pyridoxal phosphate-dependent aminotransferase [Candidatus Omnitrophota bacterium]